MPQSSACPYCDLAEMRRGAFVLENDLCLLSIKPSENGALEGAGIIIPKAHRPTVFDLTTEEWAATQTLLHQTRDHLDAGLAPDGYNVGWNVGELGGQHIMHAHFHVIPRFADEPMAGRGIRSHLKSVENRRASLLKT
ncbi:HIT family protein [Deinococcus deserti]|uniref:Putative Cell-cycle regulation histidine triad HIT protein n=1 Tax=Deinococcus deserti (strain DSM 17065 / CIP 109153 / LMG 22923 / VCD115) TaxID=546414 RepID=C1CVG7_DEIDV|nr:HIT domain-containing protein [Deinococcus deserti]ACO46184.1 putative Cell-cycle regulation histidine triad HIT protein [Deinococcus deserti VCD115]